MHRRCVLQRPTTHLALVGVQTHILRDKPDLAAGVANDLLVVNLGLGCDLSEHHDHVGLGAGFASHLEGDILMVSTSGTKTPKQQPGTTPKSLQAAIMKLHMKLL